MAEMFLKLADIEGESLDHDHHDEIEVADWQWLIQNDAPLKMNQADASTKVDVKDIQITKLCDKASVNLLRYCTLGKHIPHGTITCRKKAGDQNVEFLIITLKNVKISHMNWNWQGPDKGLTEIVKLNFEEFKAQYRRQDECGSAMGYIDFGFSLATHKETVHHDHET